MYNIIIIQLPQVLLCHLQSTRTHIRDFHHYQIFLLLKAKRFSKLLYILPLLEL